MDLCVSERQTEGGVGPAVSIEDPAWDSFHVTGDGVCHQLYGGDQEAAGQEESGGDLRLEPSQVIFDTFQRR